MNSSTQNFILKSDLSKIPNTNIVQTLIKESKYLDTSLVNGLRRYIISKINTLAVEYSPTPQEINYINFTKNNSDMNNDFIGHRIGLLPINIVGVKYLLLIYKIIKGHTAELDNFIEESNNDIVMKKLNTNLKLSDKNNITLIHDFIFYINQTTNNDIEEITTKHIELKFSNNSIKINDYKEKLKQYSKLLKIYENETNLNKIYKINHDSLSEADILKIIFPPFISPEKKEYGILLAKIKKFNKLQCDFKLNIGNGQKHSRYNTVSPCTYSFIINKKLAEEVLTNKLQQENLLVQNLTETIKNNKIIEFINQRYNNIIDFNLTTKLSKERKDFLHDEDDYYDIDSLSVEEEEFLQKFILSKDTLINNFNKCEIQRCFYGKEEHTIYERQFDFSIESVGFYTPQKIFNKGFKLLKQDLLFYINKIINMLNDSSTFPIKDNDYTIDNSTKIINGIDIYCVNSSHTIGNIISSYLYYLYKNTNEINFVSYKMIHPLKNTMLITIAFNKDIENLNRVTQSLFTNLNNIFENTNITNFIN
tara:strand:+ start:1147 stop:2751 length:1605 start_codon:yes stop_codon:yes gene_type:complete